MLRYVFKFICCVAFLGCASPPDTKGNGLISLHPAVTETIFALAAGDQLIGRSHYCTTPEVALTLPAFGTALTPNIEALALAQPRLVIVDTSNHTQAKRIGEVAHTVALPWLTTEDVITSTRTLGAHINRTEKAEALASRYETALAAAIPPNAPTAIMLLGNGELTHKTLWYIKPDSIHGSALAAAGFKNAMQKGHTGAPSISIETLIELNPDVIIVLSTEDNREEIISSLMPIKPLRAVQTNQLFVVGGSHVMGSGPSILTLVEQLKNLTVLSPK